MGIAMFAALPVLGQDTDGDTIPDAIEVEIATDPAFAEPLELLWEDGTGDADARKGAELIPAGDYTNIWFAPVARGRYVWKIDLAAETEWPYPSHDVRILYVDADNDETTGRPDAGPGCDIMFYPDREDRMIGWTRPMKSVAASDGKSIYLVADVDLNQEDGKSVFRMMLLYQDTREGQTENRDNMPWLAVQAAGESDREPVAVPTSHALYLPPQAIRHLGARVLFDGDQPRAEVTFTTDRPVPPTVEYGLTTDYGSIVQGADSWNNHRVWIEGLEAGREYHLRVRVPDRDADMVSEDFAVSTAAPASVVGSVERETVMLSVDNPHAADAVRVPITTGLPFPQGALGDDAHLRLLDSGGREMALQSEVTARWPDGSVQWALLDFVADIPAGATGRFGVEYGSVVKRTVAAEGIAIERDGDVLTVDTGVLRVTFDAESGGRLHEVLLDANGDGSYSPDETMLGDGWPGGPGITVREGENWLNYASIDAWPEIEIERAGPLVTVVRVSGIHADLDGNGLFRYVSRYYFAAGSGLVRLQHAVENDQVDQKLTRIDGYVIGLPLPLDDATVTVEGGEEGLISSLGRDAPPVFIRQDLDNHLLLGALGEQHESEHGPAALDVSYGNRGVWVGLRHFREKWPSELVWNGQVGGIGINLLPGFEEGRYAELGDAIESDRLYYHVRDGGYRLHWGMSFTREIWLGFHDGEEWPSAWAQQLREPLVAVAPPEWYCASGAFGEQLPRTEGMFPEYEEMVDHIFELLMQRRESNRSYGFLNFGDWWGERGYNWGNHEYDTPHAQMVQFARTGDRRFFDEACNSAEHMRDVDFVHHAPSSRDVHKTRAHRMFHTGGYTPRMTKEQMGLAYFSDGGMTSPLSGHQWNRGLLEHYFMTGERRSQEVGLGLAEFMAGPGTVNWTIGHGAERCAAWAIYDVISAYEATWDPFYLNGARIMVADVIRRQTEAGHFGMPAGYSDLDPPPTGGYAWCSGLLITMLEGYNRHAGDARVDEVILNAARWLAREEFIPEGKGFRSCSCDTFNDKTRPGHSAWGVANAMAHAYELSGDEHFLDLAQMTYGYYMQTAGGMGKNYSTAMVTSPHLIYKLHKAGRDDLSTARWDQPFEARLPRVVPAGRTVQVLLRTTKPEALGISATVGEREQKVLIQPGGEWQLVDLGDAPAGDSALEMRYGDYASGCALEVLADGEVEPPGEGVGLIAGAEDFLGPALPLVGVDATAIAAGDDLKTFGTIFLGTQACTLDAAGIRSDPAPLLRWLRSGGRLVVSHPNDEKWDPFLFGAPLVLQEENSTSGEIVAADHALLTAPNAVTDLAGAAMFDSVALAADEWETIVRDVQGRPAVLMLEVGLGDVVVMVPSFERYVSGELAASAEKAAQCRAFMQNLIAWGAR